MPDRNSFYSNLHWNSYVANPRRPATYNTYTLSNDSYQPVQFYHEDIVTEESFVKCFTNCCRSCIFLKSLMVNNQRYDLSFCQSNIQFPELKYRWGHDNYDYSCVRLSHVYDYRCSLEEQVRNLDYCSVDKIMKLAFKEAVKQGLI